MLEKWPLRSSRLIITSNSLTLNYDRFQMGRAGQRARSLAETRRRRPEAIIILRRPRACSEFARSPTRARGANAAARPRPLQRARAPVCRVPGLGTPQASGHSASNQPVQRSFCALRPDGRVMIDYGASAGALGRAKRVCSQVTHCLAFSELFLALASQDLISSNSTQLNSTQLDRLTD